MGWGWGGWGWGLGWGWRPSPSPSPSLSLSLSLGPPTMIEAPSPMMPLQTVMLFVLVMFSPVAMSFQGQLTPHP